MTGGLSEGMGFYVNLWYCNQIIDIFCKVLLLLTLNQWKIFYNFRILILLWCKYVQRKKKTIIGNFKIAKCKAQCVSYMKCL
jgi:hypothetical protein